MRERRSAGAIGATQRDAREAGAGAAAGARDLGKRSIVTEAIITVTMMNGAGHLPQASEDGTGRTTAADEDGMRTNMHRLDTSGEASTER